MKFSCDVDNINYIIETRVGQETDYKFVMFLNHKKKKLLEKGQIKFYTLLINAKKEDIELNFEVQGVPFNIDEEIQLEEVEDFFESQNLFQKVEHMFKLDTREEKKPHWAKY